MTEHEIQSDIIALLESHGALVIRMNAGRGRYNQRLAPAGTPDLLALLETGETIWIEVKTPTGKLRPEQVAMHERLCDMGHTVIIARGVDDVLDAL
jgi:hypothetical protein